MKRFFKRILNKLLKVYDRKTSIALANKLTKMYHDLNFMQSIPENNYTISMIEDHNADFNVVKRLVENVFDNFVIRQFTGSDIV